MAKPPLPQLDLTNEIAEDGAMRDKKDVTRVFMLTLFPHAGNGSATVVRDLATVLSPEVEVLVFYVDIEEPELNEYRAHFMVVDDFPVLRTHPKSKARRRFIAMTPEEIDAYIDRLYQASLPVVQRFQPDTIHVHHGWIGACVAKRLHEATSIPYLVQFHGTELEVRADYAAQDPAVFAYLDRIVRDGLSGAGAFSVISPSEEALTSSYAESAALTQPIEMIPNGYDEAIFFPADRNLRWVNDRFADRLGAALDPARPIVMFVGRFAGFKGIEHLLRAIPGYAATGAQTILCGDGELREAMVALVKNLELKDVHFLGQVDHFKELPTLYNAADLLVIPSKGEPFGLVAIEAMGCGTPFIGADSGALPYILSSSPADKAIGSLKRTPLGLLVPFGDPTAIGQAVNYALHNDLKGELGPKICAQVQHKFSVQVQARRYRDLYRQISKERE
jgi:glycosyltransferase involved in cell wall biosynthesis